MKKPRRKPLAAEKAEKRRHRKEYMNSFKQKWVNSPLTVDGLEVDEFIRRNADPV